MDPTPETSVVMDESQPLVLFEYRQKSLEIYHEQLRHVSKHALPDNQPAPSCLCANVRGYLCNTEPRLQDVYALDQWLR